MPKSLQAIRGMNDVLPDKAPYWRIIERACESMAGAYGYREVRFPIVELTALFNRTVGEETDIVSKEMYTFEDRHGDSLSLRPEGTAGCVRMGIEQGLLYNQIQRFWYLGSMFRRERPQKGRYRQFHHFGVEAFGMSGPEIDAEILALSARLWRHFDLQGEIYLEINNLGTPEARVAYRKVLVEYFSNYRSQLDEDSQRRLTTNPLRILDSKHPDMQDLIQKAPVLFEFLDEESKIHFEKLQAHLDALQIAYRINPHLVRGLDYYGLTVFEWVTDVLGAQGTVCAGGRYDGLVAQLGGKPTPAVGFALGLERLLLLIESKENCAVSPDIYLVLEGDDAVREGFIVAETLRNELSEISVEMNAAGGSFKSQFKRADKSGAHWAVIIADDELKKKVVSIKDLQNRGEQETVSIENLISFFRKKLEK